MSRRPLTGFTPEALVPPVPRILWLAALALTPACVSTSEIPPDAGPVDTDRIRQADREPGNWLTHGRTYLEQRFSPLDAVSRNTVAELGLAWTYELRTERGASATPLVVDGVMYVTSAWSLVYALDARDGRELWVYDPAVDRAVAARACCDVVNRGVAVYDGRVYVGVIDGRLVALNAADGSIVWEAETVDRSKPYTITGAPRAANGLVYIGNGGADYGVRGYVSAYDATNGELVWRFYTVPGDPALGPDGAASDPVMAQAAQTWTGEWWRLGGGGTVWDAIVYDPDFDQLIVGVGNGSPWNQQLRSPDGGDNWFLSSILALDAKTGAYRWHYQTTPGDTWDFAATQSIILADLSIDGRVRKVAMQAPKNGFFYLVDRENGHLLSAAPFVPMAPAAETPAGAPLSWAYAIDPAGRPLENEGARYQGGVALVRPGPLGAHNWHPMSYSPMTGLVYIPAQEVAFAFAPSDERSRRPGFWNTGLGHVPFPDDDGARRALANSAIGFLVAWDPLGQREVWRVRHRGPWNGGTLATAGGLVFQGTTAGKFRALDAASGEQLWEFDNRAATLAGPIAYDVDGDEHIAVLAGYGSAFFLMAGALAPDPGAKINGRVYAFKLGGTATAPPLAFQRAPAPRPPEVRATPGEVAQGEALYGQFCFMCHGLGAVTGGVLPDVRTGMSLRSAEAWADAVVRGSRRDKGMPGFAEYLTLEAAELIRAYVARQARSLYVSEQRSQGAEP